jgi:MFS family permease
VHFEKTMPFSRALIIYFSAALFLGFSMGVQVSPSIMTHSLMRSLHVGAYWLGIISGSFFIAYTLLQIPAGMVFDRFGARMALLIPLVVCVIGALLFGMAQNVFVSILGRLLLGGGSAFAFVGTLVVASDVFPQKNYGLWVGVTHVMAALGALGGQLPLLYLEHLCGWRGAIYGLVVFAILVGVLIWFTVDYPCPKEKLDASGKKMPFWSGVLWVAKKSQTWCVAGYACFLWAPLAVFASLWGVPFLVDKGFSTTIAVRIIAFMWLGLAMGAPLVGWLSDCLGRRRPFLLACALLGLIAFGVVVYYPHLSLGAMIFFVFLAGMSAAGQALTFAVVRDQTQTATKAVAMGFNNMAVAISGALFQPLVGKLLQSTWQGNYRHDAPVYSTASYHIALSVIFIGFLVAIFLTLFMIKEHKQSPRRSGV